jgi:hypothetical protein
VYAFYNWKKLTTYVPGVGIENQLPLVEINIYPNPVRSELKIQSPIKVIGVELLNVHGQKVGGSHESSNDLTLNLNNYTPGLYFLKIETENGVTIRKILKD